MIGIRIEYLSEDVAHLANLVGFESNNSSHITGPDLLDDDKPLYNFLLQTKAKTPQLIHPFPMLGLQMHVEKLCADIQAYKIFLYRSENLRIRDIIEAIMTHMNN